jgi:hypothetical protein
MLRRIFVLLGSGVIAVGTLAGCNAHVRGVIVFIGDSNGVRSAQAITDQLSDRDNGYVPALFVRAGAAIRSPDCKAFDRGCIDAWDFWGIRLNEGLRKIQGDAFVVELGINDTISPGTPTTRGYSSYGGKIDYLSAAISAGNLQSYTAEGFDQFDNDLGDVTGSSTFTIDPDGSCADAVCTATIAGSHTVTATDGSATGTASVTVNAGPLNHLVVSPASATISTGNSQSYTAEGSDQFNNDLGDVTGSSTFTIDPDGSCADAVCTATIAGSHTVTATDGTATGTATLTLN